jgi:hypothetical protein
MAFARAFVVSAFFVSAAEQQLGDSYSVGAVITGNCSNMDRFQSPGNGCE